MAVPLNFFPLIVIIIPRCRAARYHDEMMSIQIDEGEMRVIYRVTKSIAQDTYELHKYVIW